MPKTLRDTSPGVDPPGADTGPEPEPAPATSEGYRYSRPPVLNSEVTRLLDGLKADRFPRSETASETAGQMAAHYAAGPADPPPRMLTPPPQPSVLLANTSDVTVRMVLDTTVADRTPVVPMKRGRWAWMAVPAAALALGLVVTLLVLKSAPSPSALDTPSAGSLAVTAPQLTIAPALPPPTAAVAPTVAVAASATTRPAPAPAAVHRDPVRRLPPPRPSATKEPEGPVSDEIERNLKL